MNRPPFKEMLGRLIGAAGQSRAAKTVEVFGWLILFEGGTILLAPHLVAGLLYIPPLVEQAANYFRLVGLLIGGLGMLWYPVKQYGDFRIKLQFREGRADTDQGSSNGGVFLRFPDPRVPTAQASSSRKKGLPSAFATIASATAGAIASVASAEPSTVRLSSRDSGASATWVAYERASQDGW